MAYGNSPKGLIIQELHDDTPKASARPCAHIQRHFLVPSHITMVDIHPGHIYTLLYVSKEQALCFSH